MNATCLRCLFALLAIVLGCSSGLTAGPGDWIINEVLADPGSTSGDSNQNGIVNTSEDEFIEIFNASGEDQDISGWMIADAVTIRHTFPEGTMVPAECVVVVFGAGPIAVPFNGALMQTSSTGMLGFNNAGDSITLASPDNEPMATFEYGEEGGNNQSMTRDPDLDGDVVLHTEASSADGAEFSPGTFADGTRFEGCPDDPPDPIDTGWVINEIHADPDPDLGDANGDGTVDSGDDEFVEIYNGTDDDQDISGWSLSDGNGVRHIFLPGTVVPVECAIVVFGGGRADLEFNGSAMQIATTGALGLNNSGDTIALSNDQGVAVATATFGAEGGENQALTRDPDVEGEFAGHALVEGAEGTLFSPGVDRLGISFIGCPDEPVDPPSTEIWEIQGPGLSSPLDGQTLLTTDNVVTGVSSNGFFMQTPEERVDGDDQTSDGIFVYTTNRPDVEVGDLVDVAGRVKEHFDLTEIDRASVIVNESGHELPDPVILDETVPTPDQPVPDTDLERFEGMRVEFQGGIVTGPYNRFGELLVVARPTRAYREPGAIFPGEPGLPVWDGNPEIFEVDVDRLGLPDAVLPAGTPIEQCTGPLTFTYGMYQIQPTEFSAGPAPDARAVRQPTSNELTVATQNLYGLVDSVDDPGIDEDVADPFDYQRRLTKLALAIRETLAAPDVVSVQEVESLTVLEALAARIAEQDADVVYRAFVETGSDPSGRNIGLLVRDSIEVTAVTQIGGDDRFELDGRDRVTFTRPPLVLDGVFTEAAQDFPITVVSVHFRSLIDIATEEFVRRKRLAQAEFIARTIQAWQDDDPDRHVVVAGDFNAFEFTDAYVDVMGIVTGESEAGQALLESEIVVDPPFANHTLDLPAPERYSTVNEGSAQSVDHIITSPSLADAIVGIGAGRHSADMPEGLAGQDDSPLRSSDHDGLVLYIRVGEGGETRFIRGDFDANGQLLLNDAISVLNFLFLGQQAASCAEAADSNADGNVDLTDAVGILGYLFLGLPALPEPFPECGTDPAAARSCDSFPACN